MDKVEESEGHRPGSAPLTDLVLRCYPGQDGKSGSSLVYEDDGETRGYEHGECATTKLTYVRHGDDISISVAPTEGTFKGQPTSRRCVVETARHGQADLVQPGRRPNEL